MSTNQVGVRDLDDHAGREERAWEEALGQASLRPVLPPDHERKMSARGLVVVLAKRDRHSSGMASVGSRAKVGADRTGGIEDAEILGVPAILVALVPARGNDPLSPRGEARVHPVVDR